ncbi:MAG: helix-hairpin-helix domain-containing protein [bacterium]|nr:helix-hairpin-helix domain-containing protein [bacterium]
MDATRPMKARAGGSPPGGIMERIKRGLRPFVLLGLLFSLLGAGPLLGADATADARTNGSVAKLDLNSASFDELIGVPGIGKATAGRIITFREENGPFLRVEDLLKVKGIGEKSLEKLRPFFKVSRRR